jgi:hypothetical protein
LSDTVINNNNNYNNNDNKHVLIGQLEPSPNDAENTCTTYGESRT